MSPIPIQLGRLVLTGIALAAGVGAVLVAWPKPKAAEPAVAPAPTTAADPVVRPDLSLPLPQPALPAPIADPPLGGAASEALLAAFWGAQWPQVRAELEGTGLDVEHLPPIWPWEVAAPMHDWYLTLTAPDRIEMVFGSMFRWPSWSFWFHGRACTTTKGQWKTEGAFLEDATSLPGAHLLDPETTHAILAEVAPLNRELEGLLLEYIAELEVRLRQKFRAGEIERAPLRLRPEVRRPKFGASLYGVRPSLLGWQIEDTLTRSEAPALSEMLDRIERLKLERSAAVHSLVAARLHPAD